MSITDLDRGTSVLSGDDFVTRIDPDSGARDDIQVGDGPSAIVSGAGSIWVANTLAGTVSRIDPSTNDVVATIETGNAPSGITVAEDFVWVAVRSP